MPFWSKGKSKDKWRNNFHVTCPRCSRSVSLSSIPCQNCGRTLYERTTTERSKYYPGRRWGDYSQYEWKSHTTSGLICPSCLAEPKDLNCPSCHTSLFRLFASV